MAKTLAIALGANLRSKHGPPSATLVIARQLLKAAVISWSNECLNISSNVNNLEGHLNWRWSPLFETKPIGGPPNQDNYINAVVLIDGPKMEIINETEKAIFKLFEKTSKIENDLGRKRGKENILWGPRTIDIDLLCWGELQVKNEKLVIPHPRMIERNFVISPLAAVLSNEHDRPKQLVAIEGWDE